MISKELRNKLEKELGISVSSVLLPKKDVDMSKWSVVACDQYTSEHEYWNDVSKEVGESPSTLRLIFPEAYLESEDEIRKSERIASIQSHMQKYVDDGLFEEYKDSAILVERKFANGETRCGIVLALDLERYDYSAGSQSLIRATEGTIISRLPPRIKIRQDAPLELPHIMVLIDDRDRTVIEPLISKKDSLRKAYDFSLMKNSGSIKGWVVDREQYLEDSCKALLNLAQPSSFRDKYSVSDDYNVLLFAVGDGNHSLATAKACWENIKKSLPPEGIESHTARYALVEIVNLHDEGLVFEPINRILFNVDSDKVLSSFASYFSSKGCKALVCPSIADVKPGSHVVEYVSSKTSGYLVVENPFCNLDVATLQGFIDSYIKENPPATVDYVHGGDVTQRIGSMEGNMGFFLSPMDKNQLFKTVILYGALPRKTFSMGEASEKRFYLEARKIR